MGPGVEPEKIAKWELRDQEAATVDPRDDPVHQRGRDKTVGKGFPETRLFLHLSSQAHLQGEERMTVWEVIAFLEAQPIEKSWKELIASQAGDEGIRGIAAEAGELMLGSLH
jgi:hypothetical protein